MLREHSLDLLTTSLLQKNYSRLGKQLIIAGNLGSSSSSSRVGLSTLLTIMFNIALFSNYSKPVGLDLFLKGLIYSFSN